MCLEQELKALALPEPGTALTAEAGGVAVQSLYESCRAAFSQARIPSSNALQNVRFVLDNLKALDVGLDETVALQKNEGLSSFRMPRKNRAKKKNSSRSSGPVPCISYLHIYECGDFSMGIFCLPRGAVIPLHNHPNMTVLSKLLYGSMHIKSYDWVNHSETSRTRLAKLVLDRTMSAQCEATVLYPTSGGNMHRFTAVTSCAVLDVLAPPYSTEDGRHCTYYREILDRPPPGDNVRKDPSDCSFVWLDETQPTPDFLVKPDPYMGPKVIPACD